MDNQTPKYKLTRASDGTVPDWPYFVLGAHDLAGHHAMDAYLNAAKRLSYNQVYIDAVSAIWDRMEAAFAAHGPSDVGEPRVRSPKQADPEFLFKLCAEAEEALCWCTGSDDFAPGGKAELGWKRGPAVVLEKLKAARERFSTLTPLPPETKP